VCKLKSKYITENFDHGMGTISKEYLNNQTREIYTQLWNDNYIVGSLFALHQYATKENPLSYKEISRIIGWRWRTVKNGVWSLKGSECSILKNTISTKIYSIPCFCCKCKAKYYIDEPFILNMNLKRLIKFFYRCYYGKDNPNTPNMCEAAILEICNMLYKNQFIFTGTQTIKNRVGRYYPDISHVKYPIIIEHNGSAYHQDKEKEEQRRRYLEDKGYYLHIITDYKAENREKIIEEIKEFVDNAIQNL
jgi:very-short-patch-repair endonuclease